MPPRRKRSKTGRIKTVRVFAAAVAAAVGITASKGAAAMPKRTTVPKERTAIVRSEAKLPKMPKSLGPKMPKSLGAVGMKRVAVPARKIAFYGKQVAKQPPIKRDQARRIKRGEARRITAKPLPRSTLRKKGR